MKFTKRGILIGGGGGADTTIYTTNGTLTADRTVAGGGFALSFSNSNIDIDGNVALPSISDADEDTALYLEQSADEDRMRFEIGSTFHASGTKYLGHADDDGIEFRSFTTDSAQTDSVITATDDIDTLEANSRRAEFRLHRGDLDDTKGIPTDGTVPNHGVETGVSALMTAGRDTRLVSVGSFIEDSGAIYGGVFSVQSGTQTFMGLQQTSTLWARVKSASAESYMRVEPTRVQLRLNETGLGQPTHIVAQDTFHYSNSGIIHRPAFTAEQFVADVDGVGFQNQVFDATLRGMSWGTGSTTIGSPATGATNTQLAIGQTTSNASTPSDASVVVATECSAFDFIDAGASTAPHNGANRLQVHIRLVMEILTPGGEDIYEIQLWENNNDERVGVLHKVSFSTDHTFQTLSFTEHLPHFRQSAVPVAGFYQYELRIQRVSGSDDMRIVTDGSQIEFRRME